VKIYSFATAGLWITSVKMMQCTETMPVRNKQRAVIDFLTAETFHRLVFVGECRLLDGHDRVGVGVSRWAASVRGVCLDMPVSIQAASWETADSRRRGLTRIVLMKWSRIIAFLTMHTKLSFHMSEYRRWLLRPDADVVRAIGSRSA
jgi:hypothetical protein